MPGRHDKPKWYCCTVIIIYVVKELSTPAEKGWTNMIKISAPLTLHQSSSLYDRHFSHIPSFFKKPQTLKFNLIAVMYVPRNIFACGCNQKVCNLPKNLHMANVYLVGLGIQNNLCYLGMLLSVVSKSRYVHICWYCLTVVFSIYFEKSEFAEVWLIGLWGSACLWV